MPNTKPGVTINSNGICSACLSVENKHKIDWKKREAKLQEICDGIREVMEMVMNALCQ